ncbi:MAG: hypothetical protein COU65_04220 [Candidatus Pacebacteria bacterium CG10_big_fil_rev_8_21_14_0_10_42_12]|nr:MAG: hypothetical protein COU65_04220 [Candidatus Pacebacteria bacterium CG10_big_fil_rev_8_21_14_0_10_42_12]
MKFVRQLQLADFVSLAGILPIWLAIMSMLKNEPFLAIFFSLIAFVFDFADGWVARKQKTNSKFGLQLDTLIDALNYPLFCAIFVYLYIFASSWIGAVVSLLILVFSVLRLSRMATNGILKNEKMQKYYEGIVTPHILLAVILIFYVETWIWRQPPQLLIASLLAILSIGMISSQRSYKPKSSFWLLLAVVVLSSIALYGQFLT